MLVTGRGVDSVAAEFTVFFFLRVGVPTRTGLLCFLTRFRERGVFPVITFEFRIVARESGTSFSRSLMFVD